MEIAYSRVMILGRAREGKTCFDRALRKLPHLQDTVTSESQISHKWHTLKNEHWTEVKHEEEIEELARLIVAVYLKSPQLSACLPSQSSHSEVETKVEEIISEALDVALNDNFELTSQVKSQPFFHFWDSGSQPAFLEILPAFLTPRTMFFLVFNALKSLHTNLLPVHNIEENMQFEGEVVDMTTLDYILNWMANIHGHLMTYNEDGGVADYPRIFCIGTHGDHLNEKKKSEVKNELEGHYRKKGYSKLVEDTLILNSTTSATQNEDSSLCKIREELLKFTEEKLVKMTPLTWVLFRKALQVFGLNVISYRTAMIIGAASKIPRNDVHYALLFHHDLGAILYYPRVSSLKDIVIINPKYFIDALGKVFSRNLQNEVPDRFRKEVEDFYQCGILVEPLYVEVWKSYQDLKPNMFIEVLVHFHLATQVTTDLYPSDIKQYFIPVALSLCRDVNTIPTDDSFHAAPLHITFSSGFVPPGFFIHFVTVLAKQMQLFLDEGVYRNHVTFRYQDTNSTSIEHMIVTDHHDVIQIIVHRATSGYSPLPPQAVYPKLVKKFVHEVENILRSNTCRESNKVLHPVTSKLCYVCTSCPLSTSPHYLVLGPTGQTRESHVTCKNDIKRYRQLTDKEKVWFTSQYESESQHVPKSTAIDRFTAVFDQLSSSITPHIKSILVGLHTDGLVGFELMDELTNSQEINARKAEKLIIELERLLRSSNNPDNVLEILCSVLKKKNDPQLTQLAETI